MPNPSIDNHRSDGDTPLKNWVKVGLFIVALGLVFGADFALDIAKTYFQLIGAVLLGVPLFLAIFGSIDWVFELY